MHCDKKYLLNKGIILLLLFLPTLTMAYRPPPERPGIVNGGGEFFMTIVPRTIEFKGEELIEKTPAKSTVYKISKTGEPEKVWQVEGWYQYPRNIYLSRDGKTIIRIREHKVNPDGSYGYIHSNQGETPDQDLIAIYSKSGKVAGYTAKELFIDIKKSLSRKGWYIKWLNNTGDKKPDLKWNYTTEKSQFGDHQVTWPSSQYFELHTLEGFRFRFDLETGVILEREPYSKAKKTTN